MPSNNTRAFFELVRAGLWEKDVHLSQYGQIDFNEVYRLAEEQSVIGLVAAGLEHISDVKVPQEVALQFVGHALQLEQRNNAMNSFVANLIERLRAVDVYALLVKGQGIAQCYERPLLRNSGDIDLLLSDENYQKAKEYLAPFSGKIEIEDSYKKHIAMTINPWEVELHGTLRCGLWRKVDESLDSIQDSIFYEGKVRSWMNGRTQVFLPGPDEDIVFVFSHILQHFFKEGIGLRQVCDWCRLLYAYKDTIDQKFLYSRIRSMGCLTEWKAFAALSVDYLGMPVEAMPLYSNLYRWNRKATRILSFIFETGNFGHKRDNRQYPPKPYLKNKANSFLRHTKDAIIYFFIFPFDAIKLWFMMLKEGLIYVARGK